jgi:hypothetical protein
VSTKYYRVHSGYKLTRAKAGTMPASWWAIETEQGDIVAMLHPDHLRMAAGDDYAAQRSGGRVQVYATGLDSEWTVSEYGEPVTLGQLRRGEAP